MHRSFKRKKPEDVTCIKCGNPDLMIGRVDNELTKVITFYLICDKCNTRTEIPAEDVSTFRVYCGHCNEDHLLTDVQLTKHLTKGDQK